MLNKLEFDLDENAVYASISHWGLIYVGTIENNAFWSVESCMTESTK